MIYYKYNKIPVFDKIVEKLWKYTEYFIIYSLILLINSSNFQGSSVDIDSVYIIISCMFKSV